MQVTNHSNKKRKMKEEMLEAIYGTVERLEQKVDIKDMCADSWNFQQKNPNGYED